MINLTEKEKHNYYSGSKKLQKSFRYVSVLISSVKAGLPLHLAHRFAIMAYISGGGVPKVNNAESEVHNYFLDNDLGSVKKFKEIKSVQELPEMMGDYNLTDDVKEYIATYMDEPRKHIFVETNKGSYIARMNDRGTKLINAKNIFTVLDSFYTDFCTKTAKAQKLMQSVEQDLEEQLLDHGKIEKNTHKEMQDSLYEANDLLSEAYIVMQKLKNATEIYKPNKSSTQENIENLESLIQARKELEVNLNNQKTFEMEKEVSVFDEGFENWRRERQLL